MMVASVALLASFAAHFFFSGGPVDLVLLVLYLTPAFFSLMYTLGRLTNIIRAATGTCLFTDKPKRRAGKISPGNEPAVTIQICTYNEGAVVEETIKSACTVDWPKDKLFIDVCDDSTDPASIAIIKRLVSFWGQEVNITHRTRPYRIGYKAGSLRYHFDSIKTDFVAQFDADHRMEPDFLMRCMPHFFDKIGDVKENIGLVQAPWAFYNIHQNLLTEAGKCVLLPRLHVFSRRTI